MINFELSWWQLPQSTHPPPNSISLFVILVTYFDITIYILHKYYGYIWYLSYLFSLNQRDNTVICCARAISDEEGANRKRLPTVVYDRELLYILPNVKMRFKLAGYMDIW